MTARNHPYPPLLPILPVYPNAYANLNTPSPRFSSLSMTEVVSREMCVYIHAREKGVYFCELLYLKRVIRVRGVRSNSTCVHAYRRDKDKKKGRKIDGNPAVDIGWKEPVSPERELKIYF